MYEENVNQSCCRALRLLMTIAILPGAGGSTHLAALVTIYVAYPSLAPCYIPVAIALHHGFFREQHLNQLAGINPKRYAVVADVRLQYVTADSQRGSLRNS
jgi:hypothetical protein